MAAKAATNRTDAQAQGKRGKTTRAASKQKRPKKNEVTSESEEIEEEEGDSVPDIDSDNLDDDEVPSKKTKKRKSAPKSSPAKRSTGESSSTKKKRRVKKGEDSDDDSLPEGQVVVGTVVQAPKEGRVPAGQISQNTLNFLADLAKPECNDRDWFRLHEPVYRLAEKEWKDWIDAFTEDLRKVDTQIPPLPARDVLHRIYRDMRFSNDKTPYKTNLSASFSRSGRKGTFAHYHVSIQPRGSFVAAGVWCPGKNELSTIRHNIQRNPSRLRDIISSNDFVRFFGPPTPHPKGERQSIFNRDDELKVAPKGIAKDHKDIDLLKLRSFAVVHRFLDSEVLAPDFRAKLSEIVTVTRPLVHCLNDMMTLPADDDDDDDGEENGDD